VGLGLAAAGALWSTGMGSTAGWAPAFLRGYLLAWVCYVTAGIVVLRARRLPRCVLLWIVVAGVGMRMVCLARTPPLSTDVWRYLWDGRVTNAGINPYRHAPNAPAVRHLRDGNWGHINFKHIPTIYPPAAEMLFAALARARTSDAEAFRWVFALFDVGSVLLLVALLRRTGRRAEQAIWYAWCPLAATEATAGSHVDSFGLFLLLLALLLAARRGEARPGVGSGVALAGAAMAKGYAFLAAPFFVKRGGWRMLLTLAVVCTALLAPYAGARGRLFGGLREYLAAWETNASVFLVVDRLLAGATPLHFVAARWATTGVVLSFAVWLLVRQGRGMEWLLGATFAALAAQLMVGAPTLPWYVIWTVPLLCWWWVPGWALFTLTVSLQYYGRWLYPGDEAAHYALLWAGYLPVYALLTGQFIWWWAAGRRSAPSRNP
jgi:alpha-1,6-mannosyltransferase